MARIVDVLPVPGAPHSSTGTRAATATPSAAITASCRCAPAVTFIALLRTRGHSPSTACTLSITGSAPGSGTPSTVASGQAAAVTATTRCPAMTASPAAQTDASQPAGSAARSRRSRRCRTAPAVPSPRPRAATTSTWPGSMPSQACAAGARRPASAATRAGRAASRSAARAPPSAQAAATVADSRSWNSGPSASRENSSTRRAAARSASSRACRHECRRISVPLARPDDAAPSR